MIYAFIILGVVFLMVGSFTLGFVVGYLSRDNTYADENILLRKKIDALNTHLRKLTDRDERGRYVRREKGAGE